MRQFIRGGYPAVTLSNDHTKKTFPVHRLVALTFIENKDNLPVVNHKDGDRQNNKITNLEWTSLSGNAIHAIKTLNIKRQGIEIMQYDMLGNFIAKYDTVLDAAKAVNSSGTSFQRLPKSFVWKRQDIIEEIQPDGKEHPDYPGYIVTRDGRIYSTKTNKFLVQKSHPSGYLRVNITKGKLVDIAVHTLVASTYLERTSDKTQVNHKDRNKCNNCIENLEWVSGQENMQHVLHTDTRHIHRKSVKQFNLAGEELNTFNSIKEAANFVKVSEVGIGLACRGLQATSGGYIWRYNL